MKTFLIGDGQKSVVAEDAYECDGAAGDTLTFTRPDRPGFFLRVTVITVTFKPGTDPQHLRADYRQRALAAQCTPVDTATTTYYLEDPKVTVEKEFIQSRSHFLLNCFPCRRTGTRSQNSDRWSNRLPCARRGTQPTPN